MRIDPHISTCRLIVILVAWLVLVVCIVYGARLIFDYLFRIFD